jgi:hypothetical protein
MAFLACGDALAGSDSDAKARSIDYPLGIVNTRIDRSTAAVLPSRLPFHGEEPRPRFGWDRRGRRLATGFASA